MIKLVLFLTCATVYVLQPSSGTPAARSQAWAYLTDYLAPSDIAQADRFSRGTKEDKLDFSESADDYPAETISELITATPTLSIFFTKKKVPSFGHRHNSFDQAEDESMCNTSFMTQWPQKLTNRKGVEKFIVNQDNSYQPVYVERCKKDVTCSLKDFFPSNYQSECKQKYSVARLVALDSPTDKNLVVDEFDVPCGCVCTIRKT